MKQTPYMVRVIALARQYCEESGLSLAGARWVCGALRFGWAWDVERLPLEQRQEFDQIEADTEAFGRWVYDLWERCTPAREAPDRPQPAPPTFLTRQELIDITAHVRATIAASPTDYPHGLTVSDLTAIAPNLAAAIDRRTALEAVVMVRGEELRAFLARLTREETGREGFPDPVAWLAREAALRNERLTLEMIEHGCFHLLSLSERTTGEGEASRADIQRRRQERSGKLVLPQAVYRQFYPETPETRAHLIQRVTRGDVGIQNPEMLGTLQQASARQNTREFADITMSQIRALVGVMALLTDADETDGGRLLAPATIPVTATEFYRLAEVPSRQTKLTRALLAAMVDLTDRRVFLEVQGKDATGKTWVAMVEKPLFEMAPVFAEEDTSDELLDAWARWRGQRREGGKVIPWDGPMPRRYLFTIPNLVRQSGAPLIFSRDVLASLDEGARQVRGGKSVPRDWALWLEVARTRQARQLAFIATDGHPQNPVTSFRSYVDRRAFLKDYHGEAATHNRGRLEADYLASVEVLQRGGLTIETKLDQPLKRSSRERRDIFVPNPEKLLGVEKRAAGMLKAQATRTRKPRKSKKSKGGA